MGSYNQVKLEPHIQDLIPWLANLYIKLIDNQFYLTLILQMYYYKKSLR